VLSLNLQSSYVCSRRAFGTVSDFELYTLTFSQSFETIGLDSGEVYEYIFATIFRSNETESFGLIKPLNVTFNLRHQNYLYMKKGHKCCVGYQYNNCGAICPVKQCEKVIKIANFFKRIT